MIDAFSPLALAMLVIGLVAIATAPVRAGLARIGVPDVVGYIVIGLALAAADARVPFLSRETQDGLDTLAAVGVVILLFRAGLESRPGKMMRQLPRASAAFVGNILASGALGYLAARHLVGTELVPALFVAAALSATSVGVSVAVWREAGAIDTEHGALLLDLAELDDVAAVLMLAMLLALAPLLHGDGNIQSVPQALAAAGWLTVKLAGFAAVCLLFAHYAERPISRWFGRFEGAAASVIPIAGLAFVIAAFSEQLGFSLAIGALFAGLAFSGDPQRVRLDMAFDTLFRLFVPFFFVGIGLNVTVGIVPTALAVGGILLFVAVIGKIAGTALPLAAGRQRNEP